MTARHRLNLEGQHFGRLVAVRPAHVGKKSGWLCRCVCGGEALATTNHLRSGHVRSCGCLKVEAAKRAHSVSRTHGMTGSRVFAIWTGMIARCGNPNRVGYQAYGGRGIRVCERWSSFENFYADMGAPPPGHQLDRINNDGHYEPGNCRWVTARENSRNRRNTHLLTHNNETLCVTEWAERLGLSHQAIHQRIHRLGWPVSRALTEGAMK